MKRNLQSGVEGLSASQLDRLRRYEQLLSDQGIPLGVVAVGDRHRLWDRHVLDSLRAAGCIPVGAAVADLGSGGGLPGIPVAIARPDVSVDLVEARTRRVAFMELAAERLELPNVRVIAARAEEADLTVNGCLARALAPPEQSWSLASRLLTDQGFLIYWAGLSWGRPQTQGLLSLGLSIEVCSPPSAEWQGSVIKMARTVFDPEQGTR